MRRISKLLLLVAVLFPLDSAKPVPAGNVVHTSGVQYAIYVHARAHKAQNAAQLSADIVRVAREYGLDPLLLAAIVAQESSYRLGAVNSRSRDYGLTQVNERNVASLRLDKSMLVVHQRYSLRAGAYVLKDMLRRFPNTGVCRYNVGTGKLEGSRLEACHAYLGKIKSKQAQLRAIQRGMYEAR